MIKSGSTNRPKALVTGGAGFMGSHLVDTLMSRELDVCVFDNLSTGNLENIRQWLSSPHFTFMNGDLTSPTELARLEHDKYEVIFHLAANPEVRSSYTKPEIHYQQNVFATHNLLEFIRRTRQKTTLVFASTSTVYGEPTIIPTPEDYAPLKPISVYGATKLASETMIVAYAHMYNFKAIILRLANIIGPRNYHGVINDFVDKLLKNPEELEILGDGTQNKSYLHIADCIQALLTSLEKTRERIGIYNIGSEDQISVEKIAQLVIKEMRLNNVKLRFTGGIDGGRGWKGDVKNMLLDITRMKALGWNPRLSSKKAVTNTVKALIQESREPNLLARELQYHKMKK